MRPSNENSYYPLRDYYFANDSPDGGNPCVHLSRNGQQHF